MTKEAPINICQLPDAATLAFLQKVFCDRVRRDVKRFGPEKALAGWRTICDYMKTYDWWPSVARKVEGVFDEAPDELFHFIHPTVDPSQEKKIHDEITRLVKRHGIQDICQYLEEMRDEKKVLLPQIAEKLYNELVRLGMPDGEGYSLKTFMRYYKR
jgi:hypothetical protein